MSTSIVIVCPDTNIKIWATRTRDAATGGGKSAILQLARAWVRLGCDVTITGCHLVESEADGVRVMSLDQLSHRCDIAIFVTGSREHFNVPGIDRVHSAIRILWMNSPNRIEPPPGNAPDLYVAPARFMARRAADEWGFPIERIVVIPGESATRQTANSVRDPYALVYASHPFKGLENAVRVAATVREAHHQLRLDVYGSATLWGDSLDSNQPSGYPDWVCFKGSMAPEAVGMAMTAYGAMLYITPWRDAFSLATAEALAAGVIVIATDHGSNGELIRRGWNGFLVSADEQHQPNLDQAVHLLRQYFDRPAAFDDVRHRAAASVPTWDEQAAQWMRAWEAVR